MILAPTWKAYFASRESNARGNKSPAAYLTAWSNTATPESKLNLLTNDPDTAILAGDSGQGIMVLHSFKNLGGTILSPSDKVACLLGGTRMAPILVVNKVTTFGDIEIVTPSANDIRACASIEELLDLHAPLIEENPDTISFRGTNSFLPPPWLLDTVLNTRSDNPHELILAAKAGASLFDQQQLAIDPTYVSTTDAILDEFVMWAWAVKKSLVPPLVTTLMPMTKTSNTTKTIVTNNASSTYHPRWQGHQQGQQPQRGSLPPSLHHQIQATRE